MNVHVENTCHNADYPSDYAVDALLAETLDTSLNLMEKIDSLYNSAQYNHEFMVRIMAIVRKIRNHNADPLEMLISTVDEYEYYSFLNNIHHFITTGVLSKNVFVYNTEDYGGIKKYQIFTRVNMKYRDTKNKK